MITDEQINTIVAPKIERLLKLGHSVYFKHPEIEVISASKTQGIRGQYFSDVSGQRDYTLNTAYFKAWNLVIPDLSTFENWFYISLTINELDQLTSAQ